MRARHTHGWWYGYYYSIIVIVHFASFFISVLDGHLLLLLNIYLCSPLLVVIIYYGLLWLLFVIIVIFWLAIFVNCSFWFNVRFVSQQLNVFPFCWNTIFFGTPHMVLVMRASLPALDRIRLFISFLVFFHN